MDVAFLVRLPGSQITGPFSLQNGRPVRLGGATSEPFTTIADAGATTYIVGWEQDELDRITESLVVRVGST